jgi:hypothetical protein
MPPWNARHFGDLAPEEREKIMHNNQLSPLPAAQDRPKLLRSKEGQEEGVQGTQVQQGTHHVWLHEIMIGGKAKVNKAECKESGEEEELSR